MEVVSKKDNKTDFQIFLKCFKENKEIIILAPTLLGGVYQLLNIIYYVGIPYIRYFSVSQVIPDGLLISIICIIFYYIYGLSAHLYQIFVLERVGPKISHSIFNYCFVLFTCASGILYSLHSKAIIISSLVDLIFRELATLVGIILIISGLSYFQMMLALSAKKNSLIHNINFKSKFILILIFIPLALSDFITINRMLTKSQKIENIHIFSRHLEKKFNLNDEPILLYINRDYAFYKMSDNDDQILIVDSKKLTEIQ